MTLEVQISTYGRDGLERVGRMALPRMDGVRYFVSFQNPDCEPYTVPESLAHRTDVEISEHRSRGLSANRNHALSRGNSDIILIADDDLSYNPQGLQAVIDAFETHPWLDFATFKYSGADAKTYPTESFDLSQREPKGYYVSSIEMALRRESILADMRFNENFGVGTPRFGACEDSIFLLNLQRNNNLRGRFFPIVITQHCGPSTGRRRATPSVLRAQGAWLRLRYGAVMGLVRLVRDVSRRNAPWPKALWYMVEGYFSVQGV